MAIDGFGYQREIINVMRRALLAPHPDGDEHAYAYAFSEFRKAFADFDKAIISDAHPQQANEIIRGLSTKSVMNSIEGLGSAIQRAQQMSLAEKKQFSHAVDDLATWLDAEYADCR